MIRTDSVALLLITAERSAALLDRVTPTNFSAELVRLSGAWERGQRAQPQLTYPTDVGAPPSQLSQLRRHLDELSQRLSGPSPWSTLVAQRARELCVELALCEALGTPAMGALAATRYPSPGDAHGKQAEVWAEQFAALGGTDGAASPDGPAIMSDDATHVGSLLMQLRKAIGAARVPVRVEVRQELSSMAVAGEGFVAIRAGEPLTVSESERLVVHELLGHVLPRFRASVNGPMLFRAGTSGSDADEEGYALLLEKRADLFDGGRRFALGLRHIGAGRVREGAEFRDLVEDFTARGASVRRAVALALRLVRGGGIGRELAYLPALSRVERGLGRHPWLVSWLERGRVSLAAAKVLEKSEACPEFLPLRR